MAITNPTAKIVSAGNTANLTAYDTAVVTLDAGKWYTVTAHGYRSGGFSNISSIVHDPLGTPLNFVLVTDGTTSARAQLGLRGVEVWAVKPASTTASAKITITFAAGQSAAAWSVTEWSAGVDPTTFAVQVVTNTGSAGTASSITMAAFGATDNATILVTQLGTSTADPAENIVINESRVELSEIDDAERGQHAYHYQNPNGSDTSLTASWTNAEDWRAIGIEVKAAAAAGIPQVTLPPYAPGDYGSL